MAYLTVYTDDVEPTRLLASDDAAVIADVLSTIGVSYDTWDVVEVAPGTSGDSLIEVYREQVDAVSAAQGYVMVDAMAIAPSDDPGFPAKAKAAREKFLAEHTHDDDEVRYFAHGAGIFYLHVGDRVYAVLGEAGDLLSVPRGTTHWFDMGTTPEFAAIRFFRDEDGWVGSFTGNPLAERIPDFDTIVAGRHAVAV